MHAKRNLVFPCLVLHLDILGLSDFMGQRGLCCPPGSPLCAQDSGSKHVLSAPLHPQETLLPLEDARGVYIQFPFSLSTLEKAIILVLPPD